MAGQRALIIGGGIAGLCTGVYLRRAGFDTEILEQHAIAGGLATAWKRQGYTFENCIHWLVGSRPGGDLNATWKEVCDLDALTFYEDEVYQVIEAGARSLTVYRDVDRLEAEFLAHSPVDAAAIRELAGLVRRLSRFRMTAGDSPLARLGYYLSLLPLLPALGKWSKLTTGQYAQRFRDPLLRAFFDAGLPGLSFLAIAFTLAWMSDRNAGYPIGGSPAFIGLIQRRYEQLGGALRCGARVDRIVEEEGRACGVVLAGGERLAADVVVSAADGHATVFGMLEGRHVGGRTEKAFKTYRRFPSYVQVSLGVAADLAGTPSALSCELEPPLQVDPQTTAGTLAVRVFAFDRTMAPPGKTAAVVFIATDNDEYWQALREQDQVQYQAEKDRVAAAVVAAFERRFDAARGRIEVVDTATPATVIRYTGNWRGSMEGWLMTPATGVRPLPCVLPGLRAFYMVGQWTSPGGGLPSGLMTARSVTKRICRDRGLRWRPA